MNIITKLFITFFLAIVIFGCASDEDKRKLVSYFEETIAWMESEEFDQYRGDLDAISQKQIEIAEQLGLTKEDVLNLSAKYTDDTDIDNLTSRVLELLSKTEKAQN